MNFLYPGMLWALPLVAVPIVIHLLNRQRYQRVEFGAMEFLRRAIKRTRRRVLLEDMLLLALRTLAVLFLILGLAGPTVGPGSILGTRPPRAEVLVLDQSMSMNLRTDGGSSFDRARTAMRALLNELDPARGDRAALILAGPHSSRPAYGDPTEVLVALDELSRASAGTAALADALESARRTAETLEAESSLAPTIRVYSDLQASSWTLDGPLGEVLQRIASEGRNLKVTNLGREGANTAVVDLQVEPQRLTTGDAAEVRAKIRRFGPPRTVRATLLLDGEAVRTESFELGFSAEVEFSHLLQPASSGSRALSLQLDGDELADDDARFEIVQVTDALPTLVVGRASREGEPEGVFDSVLRYLDLGETGPLLVSTELPSNLQSADLNSIGLVVLADPGSLSPGAQESLLNFVRGGGGLWLLAGPETDTEDLGEVWKQLTPEGLSFDAPVLRDAEATTRLAILDPDHPSTRLFEAERWRPLLTEVPHLQYRPIRSPAESAELNRVLRFVDPEQGSVAIGDALVTWRAEGGRLALLTAVPHPAWNLMNQVPGGTLPLLLDLALSLAPRTEHKPTVGIGEALQVELPGTPASVNLVAPDGRRSTPTEPASPLPGGRTVLTALEEVLEPGIWTVESSLLEADGLERRHVEKLAANPPASESDPTPVDEEVLRLALPEGSEILNPDQDATLDEDPNQGARRLAELMFLLMAAFLLCETLLATLLDRRRG